MPTVINVDGLEFEFPDGWSVSKYDEWKFYRHQFQPQMTGLKAVDLVAVNGSEAYLIVKSLLKAVDPRITVSSRQSQDHVSWSVT